MPPVASTLSDFLHDTLLCTLVFPFLKCWFSHTLFFHVLIIYKALAGLLPWEQCGTGNVGDDGFIPLDFLVPF